MKWGTEKILSDATGFFRVEEVKGRWWFITPDGRGFLSLGINHIDSSTLKYPDNIHIWRENYANQDEFITKCVRPDLLDWGFNTIGWTQEMGARFRDHSLPWSHDEYKTADMPYCHLIRFTNMEMWNKSYQLPDIMSPDFEEWCDFQARQICPDMADDPNLIGYFYSDIPAWQSTQHGKSLMDGFNLDNSADHKEFLTMVERYYQVIHDSIRRYDKNHLLLGDRYNGNSGVSDDILNIAAKTIDVVSIQHFKTLDIFIKNMKHYHELTGKPIINGDVGFHIHPFGKENPHGVTTQRERGEAYVKWAGACFAEPHFIGWHWCAYMENKVRQAGFKNRFNEPYEDALRPIREFHKHIYSMGEE